MSQRSLNAIVSDFSPKRTQDTTPADSPTRRSPPSEFRYPTNTNTTATNGASSQQQPASAALLAIGSRHSFSDVTPAAGDLDASTRSSVASQRRAVSGRLEHSNPDTTSQNYQRANVANTAELLAASGGFLAPTLHNDIHSAPIESSSIRDDQPQRPTASKLSAYDSNNNNNPSLFSPQMSSPTGQTPQQQQALLSESFNDNLSKLRSSVLTKGGLSYELTHRCRLDRHQFVPSDVTPSSLGSHAPSQPGVDIYTPGLVMRGSQSQTTPHRSGSNVGTTYSNNNLGSPLRTAPLQGGFGGGAAHSTPRTRGSIGGTSAGVTSPAPNNGLNAAADEYFLVPTGGSNNAVIATGGSTGWLTPGAFAHRTPRRISSPIREGSAVVSPGLGAMVIGYDYASRMQLVTPRSPNNAAAAGASCCPPSPGEPGFTYSRPVDRSSPGHRAISPVDRYRPRARYC